jgi:hypothetical protein
MLIARTGQAVSASSGMNDLLVVGGNDGGIRVFRPAGNIPYHLTTFLIGSITC